MNVFMLQINYNNNTKFLMMKIIKTLSHSQKLPVRDRSIQTIRIYDNYHIAYINNLNIPLFKL